MNNMTKHEFKHWNKYGKEWNNGNIYENSIFSVWDD